MNYFLQLSISFRFKILMLAILVIPSKLFSQCDVVINEIMFSPYLNGPNSMHNADPLAKDSTAEWIELYNPGSCDVDLSCWVLGSNETQSVLTPTGTAVLADYGMFVFPAGTTIPARGYLVVGGVNATPKDFDCQNSVNYCGLSRWFLVNAAGWVALYTKTGTIKDAVYWSNTGSFGLQSSGAFNNSMATTTASLTCGCAGTVLNNTLAKNIPGIEFAGSSSGTLGQGWKRTVDGGSTWASETPPQSTPKAANGAIPPPYTANISVTNPGCGNLGTATVTPSGSTAPYTYSWTTGATTQNVSGLAAGNYTCIVTDACGCTRTATASILPAAAPFSVTVTSTNVSCFSGNNGVASTQTSIGGSYTYTWNTTPAQHTQTASGLSAGAYTVTVSNGTCSATQTVTITQPTQIIVGTNSSPSTCNGSNGSATANPSGGTPAYTFTWSPSGGNSQTANNLPAGSYVVTVSDSKQCVSTVTVNVTNNSPLITVNITATPANCTSNNGSATANPSGGTAPYNYSWNTSPVQTTQTASNLPSGVFSVIVTDGNGCSQSQTVTVGNTGGLTSAASGTDEHCGSHDGSVSINPNGGTAPFQYSWNTSPVQATATATNIAAGSYIGTITDANGCVSSSSVTIQNITLISATISGNPALCTSANGSATLTATTGTGPFTYLWSNAQTTSIATGLIPGTYSCTITDNLGCSLTETVIIGSDSPSLISTIASTVAICTNSNGIASVTPTSGTGPYNYTWNNAASTQQIANLYPGLYSVTITDSYGCTGTQTVSVGQQNDVVTISPTVTDENCGNGNGQITINISGGTTPYTYSWSNSSTAQNQTGLSAGNFSVTVTDANGCISSTTAIVQNITTIAASGSSDPAICLSANGSATITATAGSGPFTYTWSNSQSSSVAIGLTPGNYSCIVTDNLGCSTTVTLNVGSTNSPITSVGSSTAAICTNSNGIASVIPTSGTTPYTYNWSNGITTQTNNDLLPGTYSVVITDVNGCTGSQIVDVGVQINTLSITTTVVDEQCGNSSGQISTNVSGGASPYSYLWNNSSSSQNLNALSAGNYSVVITDVNGCKGNDSAKVQNIVNFSFTSSSGDDHCNQKTGFINIVPGNGQSPFNYVWNTGAVSQNLNNLSPGTYSVLVSDALGCKGTQSFTIANIDDVFSGSIEGLSQISQDEFSIYTANIPGNWTIEAWLNSNGDTIKTHDLTVNYPYPSYGNYQIALLVKSNNGCTEKIYYSIYVEPDWTFYVPNAVTFNNDNINDYFHPKCTGVQEIKGWIFDRWGNVCYTYNSLGDKWDGTVNGKVVQQDVYAYKFIFKDLKGHKHNKVGHVTVLK